MPSKSSTILVVATILGSLLQPALAAPEAGSRDITFAPCIQTCARNSGCFSDFSSCICKQASSILSDIVICMNQECPASVNALVLIQPLQSSCKIPASVVATAENIGGISGSNSGSGKSGSSSISSSQEPKGTTIVNVGAPVTAPAPTTVTTPAPVSSGDVLTVPASAAPTALLTDTSGSTPTTALIAASTPALPHQTGTSGSSTNSDSPAGSDNDNAAGFVPVSMFGVVVAMGVALAMGF
ncbi:hypothetical protein F5Y16DRAFT_56367 [Xylariaceae sp. FL0255]|nr:hypothetical protein F5Y16DRAFT_56367 [Xylariaceae sp. FL0255]